MAGRYYKSIIVTLRALFLKNSFLLISGIFIVIINPLIDLFTPRCLIKELTGFYCAGCGMTTGFYSLIRGDVTGASERNLLIVTLLPAAFFYLLLRKIIFKYSGKYNFRYDLFIIIIFILSVISFTVCRNIFIPEFDILRPH